jgi:DNA-binding transcriptional LysR family regulator
MSQRIPIVNFRTIDLNLLRVFDAVMAEGSLTRAAAVLSMTQPAASHALKRLHDTIGETLFVRTANGMKPTPRSSALWPPVRAALSGLQDALAPAASPAHRCDQLSRRDGRCEQHCAGAALVRAIKRARRGQCARAAAWHRAIRDRCSNKVRPIWRSATFWLIAALVAQGPDAALRHARLYETRYVCVMRRDHPLARKRLTLDTFCDAQHLGVSFSGRAQGPIDRALADIGRQRRLVLTVNQFFTAGRVVAQSDLLTVLPLSFLAATGIASKLVTRELPFDPGAVHVEMVWHLRRDADPAHRWLREVLAAGVKARA